MEIRRATALLRLAPFALLLAPGLAQAPAAFSSPTAAPRDTIQDEEATADRRRVLQLEDGRRRRVRSRFVDGQWQEKDGPGWVSVPGRVVSARLEKELLAEARKRASAIGRSAHDERVLLARWMVTEGLHGEALAQLDRVLRNHPDHTGALYVIRSERIELDLPAETRTDGAALVRETVLAGARGTPAVREVAAQRLADLAGQVDLRKLVEAEMVTYQDRRREFGVLAARRLFPGELLRELSNRAILDGHEPVRLGAARGLRDANDVAVLAPAIHGLSSKHANVRANSAEAMGNIAHPAAVEPLINHLAALQAGSGTIGHRANIYIGVQTAYVADYDVEIAQAASIADPIVAVQESGVVLDARATIQMTKVVEMRKVMGSLRQLTSEKIGDHPNAWAAWWTENQADWRSLDRSHPETPGSGTQSR